MRMTEAQLRQLIRERMTQFSNKPWLISKVLIAAPAEEGGNFELEEPVKLTEPQHKNILDLVLKMGIPDPDLEDLKRKNKAAREKPNPYVNPDGTPSDEEYTDEWGRTMTPAKRFKELEVMLAKTPEDREKIRKKRKEEEEEKLRQMQDEPTRFEEHKMKITTAQLKSLIEAEVQENKKKKKKKKTDFDPGGEAQYRANRSQKQIDKQADLTRKYNAAKTEKQKQKYRDMIDRSREKEGVDETASLTKHHLKELISEVLEAEKLAIVLEKVEELEEKKKRKKRKKKKSGKSSKGLSAAVKKSLDKKADRRGLTRGSVYAEFRKGLAAYYSSGSRKGMSAHQWAHARVNSANPSKSWAVVKKSKAKKKKRKKK
tara:strand:- start:415 stop:1530 length:1116 start_codon:yes stop_codon:yes gene_type:complete